MTRVAYIAGPVTGKPDDNRPAFEAARETVAGILGLRLRMVSIPHDLFWPGYPGGEARKMEACLSHICCLAEDGHDLTIVALPGWRESLGSIAEVALARKLAVPVMELVGGELIPTAESGSKQSGSVEAGSVTSPKSGAARDAASDGD